MNTRLDAPHDSFLPTSASTRGSAIIRTPGDYIVRVWVENKGLIFIVLAQMFGAVMGTGVKVLTALPNPVPVLEVKCRCQ